MTIITQALRAKAIGQIMQAAGTTRTTTTISTDVFDRQFKTAVAHHNRMKPHLKEETRSQHRQNLVEFFTQKSVEVTPATADEIVDTIMQ